VWTDRLQAREPWRPPSLILEVDPPYHDKTAGCWCVRFRPGIRIAEGDTSAYAEKLIDELLEKGTFDAVPELASAIDDCLPAAVGLQEIDTRRLVDYGAMTFNALAPTMSYGGNLWRKPRRLCPGSPNNAEGNACEAKVLGRHLCRCR